MPQIQAQIIDTAENRRPFAVLPTLRSSYVRFHTYISCSTSVWQPGWTRMEGGARRKTSKVACTGENQALYETLWTLIGVLHILQRPCDVSGAFCCTSQ